MELKQKVRNLMLDHLKTKGYPNMTPQQIVEELKPMWILIEEAGLKQEGWSFEEYYNIAMHTAMHEDFRRKMGV